ncbi:AMP-binding protein [Pseudomonas protegens]|uniref:AMP-binding protein n=1 Tax=Pseudomonas protegens TaxID=380021 RepID=UPI001B333DFD|nr:AMP-binding protein [Pseudomonas protegens]MBP5124996.1 AMP-binding protein [Pseudomonas protegens]
MLQAFTRMAGTDVAGVIDVQGSLGFAALDQLREGVSAELQGLPEPVLALYASHGRAMYAALIAALSAARRVVFIDPASNLDELMPVLQHLGVNLVLNGTTRPGSQLTRSLPVLDLQHLQARPVPPGREYPLRCQDYVIFTSGSTGEPKAIVQRIEALGRHIDNYIGYVGIGPGQRVLQLASAGWDAGLMDIFASLKTGATLCSLNPREHDFAAVEALIAEHDIDVLHMTVPYLRAFYSDASAIYARPKQLVIGGEIIHPSDIQRFNHAFAPGSQLFNAYGPTECTTALYARIDQGQTLQDPTWALDRPVEGVTLDIAKEPGQPYGEGVGELLLYSSLVARRLDPASGLIVELTQPSPLDSQRQCYATGDLACRQPDGAVRLLGRKDSIVKINGQKVSLVQVESELKALAQVREACVIAHQAGANVALVAFVIARDASLGEDLLRQAARAALPAHRVPARFLLVERFALNRNNKIDRQALAQLAARAMAAPEPAQAAPEPFWQAIGQVLGGQSPDRAKSFIDNGGDSLRALQVVATLKRKGLVLDLEELLSDQALGQLPVHAAAAKARPGVSRPQVEGLPNRRFLLSRGISDLDHWNQALVLDIAAGQEPQRVSQALRAIFRHHFIEAGVQDQGLQPAGTDLQQAVQRTCAAISLSQGQLFCFSQQQDAAGHHLIIAGHQFQVDRYSWMLLVSELDECLGQGLECMQSWPRPTAFEEWQQSYQREHAAATHEAFWEALPWGRCAQLTGQRPEFPRREAFRRAELCLGPVRDLPQWAQGVAETSQLLLAAILRAMSQSEDNPFQKVHLLDHGRALDKSGAELNSVFGWLTVIYPLVLQVASLDLEQIAREIKAGQQASQGIAHSFGNRYFATPEAERLKGLFDCGYSYNFLGAVENPPGARVGVHPLSLQLMQGSPSHHLEFTGYLAAGELLLKIDYDPQVFGEERLESLLTGITAALS